MSAEGAKFYFMSKKMVASLIACCLIIGTADSQSLNQRQFLSYLDSITNKLLERIPVIPAISITIVNENGPVHVKAYGLANKSAGIKADVNTEFYIASTTKSFMGLAAAMLDYEKKILLDNSVKSYLRNVPFKTDIGDEVTIKNLLAHTSGLENSPLTFRMAYSGTSENKEMMNVLASATTVKTKPGKFAYDNLGYNIYGLIVEDNLHKRWQDLLQEKIFGPLGMKHTTAYISTANKNKWTIANPYYAFGANGPEEVYLKKEDNTMQSAGGLITTPSDIALWLQAQINDGKLNNKQIFPAEVMKTSRTGVADFEKGQGIFSAPGKYALGWMVSKYREQPVIYHFGGYPGYGALISFMPEKKMGLAIFVNEGTIGNSAASLISGIVYDWIAGQDVVTLYKGKIEEMEENYKKAADGSQRSFADRAKRTSQLGLPLSSYVGKYQHPYYGDINIGIENNALSVKMGNLHCISTPFTEKETIRVELIPGSGRVVYFKVDDGGKVNRLTFEGDEYKRVN